MYSYHCSDCQTANANAILPSEFVVGGNGGMRVLLGSNTLIISGNGVGNDKSLVNINTTTALIHDFQRHKDSFQNNREIKFQGVGSIIRV